AFDGLYKYIHNYDGEFVEDLKKGRDALESANYGTAKTLFMVARLEINFKAKSESRLKPTNHNNSVTFR
ncbi:hypothetical protein THIOM_003490, partial [Candidatus Thiomargarita nelsonii]